MQLHIYNESPNLENHRCRETCYISAALCQLAQYTWSNKWNKKKSHWDFIIFTFTNTISDTIIQFLTAKLIDVISGNVIIALGNLSNSLWCQLCAHMTEASWYVMVAQVNLTALAFKIPCWFELYSPQAKQLLSLVNENFTHHRSPVP